MIDYEKVANLMKNVNDLPKMAYHTLASDECEVIKVFKGVQGYIPYGRYTSEAEAAKAVKFLNDELGVSPEEAEAMLIQSFRSRVKFALVRFYSFDPQCDCWIYDSWDEALDALIEVSGREANSDNDHGYNTDYTINKDDGTAELVDHFRTGDETTYWKIAEVNNQ